MHKETIDTNCILIRNRGKIIDSSDSEYGDIIDGWANLIKKNAEKGLIPLFITGSGTSIDADIPDIWAIVNQLKLEYEKKSSRETFKDVTSLFEKYDDMKRNKKSDRTIIASLLRAFQEHGDLKPEWQKIHCCPK